MAGGSGNETVQFSTNCSNGGFGADDETGNVYVKVFFGGGSFNCSSNYSLTWGND